VFLLTVSRTPEWAEWSSKTSSSARSYHYLGTG